MRLDEAGLVDYVARFEVDALRHETLQRYAVPSDGGDFDRYFAGEPDPDPEIGRVWRDKVARRAAEGRVTRRVRILRDRPSEYVCFEAEWQYTRNEAAGERIRILDLTETARPPGLIDDELWVLDGRRVVVMHYDESGAFDHGEALYGTAAAPYVASAEAAWSAGEPFAAWWMRHPQYHRAHWVKAGG